ncbi:alpha/beta hydrolase [Thalassotalea fusca]
MSLYHGFTAEQLATEYSPSSCIDDINEFITRYIDQSAQAKLIATNNHSIRANLSYGNKPAQTIDLFMPTTSTCRKLHVYIHGGYWQELSKDESSFAATNFQQHGVHFAVINYTLAPNASLSDIVTECRAAVAWLRDNADTFGYDKNEIYLSGSSAGAHLAAMCVLDSTLPIKGICAVSGVYDLTPIQLTYINEPLQLTPQETSQNSPLNHVSRWPRGCHCIVAYGDNETGEFKRQSNQFFEQLRQNDHEAVLHEITDRNHFDVILDLADNNSWLFKQAAKQMQLID